jgi:asparaginyl-tRNA synthetase
MISSPGSLTGTIISDVEPFKINFFEHETFLTQSSQLYLEFAINAKGINKVFCWDKSFRRERADFRHLPEFTHVEFEGNIDFEQNLNLQERFLKYIISKLLTNNKKELLKFLSEDQIKGLKYISELPKFKRITFHNAFKLLYEKTKNEKYLKPSITKFGAYEEILLTEIIGDEPIFIINYISDEVAFYHANKVGNPSLAVNADLLFPGYGEIIGSGERVHTKKDTEKKAKHFELDMDDYKAYIDSRDSKNPIIHSGWGMGVDRFIQCMLHLPFVWEAKVFPRVDNSNRP